MTNGITIQPNDEGAFYFDYWLNETCSSGFKYNKDSPALSWLFIQLKNNKTFWETRLYNKYKNDQTLAVPEQLVWWEDDKEI